MSKQDEGAGKRVLAKAVVMQGQARAKGGGSKQMTPDPFGKKYGEYGLVVPPYTLERLVDLKESNPIHAACIAAKAADIAGTGWLWSSDDEKTEPDATGRDRVSEFLKHCNPMMTFRQILQAVWSDFETCGWGFIEVVTDGKGEPVELYHVPAHTMRAHNDQKRFAQYQQGKVRWFKRFRVDTDDYDLDTGDKRDGLTDDQKAGELIVLQLPGGRSAYYGIPDYLSALGAIVGSLAVRDFNIDWFTGRTIPDVLLIVEGADVASDVSDTLQTFFSADTRAKHNKLAILPIPGEFDGQVKARIEKLTPDIKDASFRLYKQDNAMELCVAHRVPPYRIGWPIVGNLGGSTSEDMNNTYKRSVIEPGQESLEHLLNTFLFAAFEDLKGWEWKCQPIDTEDESADLDYAIKAFEGGLMKRNEGRQKIGLGPLEGKLKEEGEKFYQSNSLVEVGAPPEVPPEESDVPPGKGDPLQKAAANPRDLEQWGKDWIGLHKKQEAKLAEATTNFFPDRRDE